MSPDLNPVEHVWPLVTQKLEWRIFKGVEELWVALEAAFNSIDPQSILALYASMQRRLTAAIVSRGCHTKY